MCCHYSALVALTWDISYKGLGQHTPGLYWACPDLLSVCWQEFFINWVRQFKCQEPVVTSLQEEEEPVPEILGGVSNVKSRVKVY